MNQDAIAAWIGRKCRLREGDNIASQREFTLLEVIEEGTRNVIFRAADNYGESVIEFPRNHLGFHICMPPNRLFPEFQGDKRYDERLLSRVTALQSSDVVSTVFPLEGLWNALAVRRLRVSDVAEQSNDDEDYSELSACDLVNGKLIAWAACNIGRGDDEMVVIYENEKPIHTDSAAHLARDAQAALGDVDAAVSPLRENPYSYGLPQEPQVSVCRKVRSRSLPPRCKNCDNPLWQSSKRIWPSAMPAGTLIGMKGWHCWIS
jgi:hypothetical protein